MRAQLTNSPLASSSPPWAQVRVPAAPLPMKLPTSGLWLPSHEVTSGEMEVAFAQQLASPV